MKMIRNLLILCLMFIFVSGQFNEDDDFEEEVPSTHIPQLLSMPTTVEVTAGEDVNFPCDVDDLGDYVLLWKKGANQVLFAGKLVVFRDSRFGLSGSKLTIKNVQPQDHGEFICQISSNPPVELKHKLNVLYPPTVKPQPRDGFITAKEGETIALSCEAKGNPPPKISWKHAGRNYDINGGRTYLISNIQKSAAGEYECIADNGIGDPAKAIITVEVVSAPKINAHPSSGRLVVKEGESIEIACEASGDPMPVVTWKKSGDGDKILRARVDDRIIISEANRSHAGSYECIANNSLGVFTSAVIHVQVQYPPEIKVPSTWIHAGEGTNVNLTCTVKGEPLPTVTWKRDDSKVLHSNEHYHLKIMNHHHILTIHHLKEEDFGRYECVASNPLSTVAENIHIIGTPQVPTFTSKPHGPHGTRFTLTWMVKSHTPIDEYSLIYRKKSDSEEWTKQTIISGEESKGHHEGSYELKDLEPATTYEAVVTARNKFGWSKQSDAFVFTTKHSERIHDVNPSVETDKIEEPYSNEKNSELTKDGSYCLQSSWLIVTIQAVFIMICLRR